MTRVRGLICIALFAAVGLAGCGHRPDPRLHTLGIDPALLDPLACPAWPSTVPLSDLESSEYTLGGYEAYRCERSTRMKIREQNGRQNENAET